MASLANSSGDMRGVVGEDNKMYNGENVGATVGQIIMFFSGLSLVLNKDGLRLNKTDTQPERTHW